MGRKRKSDSDAGDGKAAKKANWPKDAKINLLLKYHEYQIDGKFRTDCSHQSTYEELSTELNSINPSYLYTANQLRDKIGNLKSEYRRDRMKYTKSGSAPNNDTLYAAMKTCFEDGHAVDPSRGSESIQNEETSEENVVSENILGNSDSEVVQRLLNGPPKELVPVEPAEDGSPEFCVVSDHHSQHIEPKIREQMPDPNVKDSLEIKTSRRNPAITTQFLNEYKTNSKDNRLALQAMADYMKDMKAKEDVYLQGAAVRETFLCNTISRLAAHFFPESQFEEEPVQIVEMPDTPGVISVPFGQISFSPIASSSGPAHDPSIGGRVAIPKQIFVPRILPKPTAATTSVTNNPGAQSDKSSNVVFVGQNIVQDHATGKKYVKMADGKYYELKKPTCDRVLN